MTTFNSEHSKQGVIFDFGTGYLYQCANYVVFVEENTTRSFQNVSHFLCSWIFLSKYVLKGSTPLQGICWCLVYKIRRKMREASVYSKLRRAYHRVRYDS